DTGDDAQPLTCTTAETGDGGCDEGEDQNRDEEVQEVAEQAVEGGEDLGEPHREEEAAGDSEDDRDDHPEQQRRADALEVHGCSYMFVGRVIRLPGRNRPLETPVGEGWAGQSAWGSGEVFRLFTRWIGQSPHARVGVLLAPGGKYCGSYAGHWDLCGGATSQLRHLSDYCTAQVRPIRRTHPVTGYQAVPNPPERITGRNEPGVRVVDMTVIGII